MTLNKNWNAEVKSVLKVGDHCSSRFNHSHVDYVFEELELVLKKEESKILHLKRHLLDLGVSNELF